MMAVVCVCSFSLIIGSCMILTTFCSEFQQSLKKLNKDIEKNAYVKALSEKDRNEMRNAFYDFIQFHADIRQLRTTSFIFSVKKSMILMKFSFFKCHYTSKG